jgi:hypothetical protein
LITQESSGPLSHLEHNGNKIIAIPASTFLLLA